MADVPAGGVLDRLGVVLNLDGDDLVADAIVILKVVRAAGGVAVVVGASETLDWVNQRGLLATAVDLVRGATVEDEDDT